MKKNCKTFICVILGMLLTLSAVACNGNQGGENPLPNDYTRPSNPNIDNTFMATGNTLVAYFSQTNRTKSVAETISELSGADIFEIDTAQPYTSRDLDYSINNNRPEVEHNTNARPELATYLPDDVMAQYDTIILGFPIWWHTAPMAVLSFLNYYDLSDKTVYTFATSGGSPISESTADIRSNTIQRIGRRDRRQLYVCARNNGGKGTVRKGHTDCVSTLSKCLPKRRRTNTLRICKTSGTGSGWG